MVRVGDWARQFAVGHALGVQADVLNDDRIARALDALAPVLEQVTGSVGAAAIAAFGVDVSQIRWDMTPVSLHGAYQDPGEDYAQPRYGHPEDRRADLKQIQAGVATAADGAVPPFWAPYSRGAGEASQVTGAMDAPRTLAAPRRLPLARRSAPPRCIRRPSQTYAPGQTLPIGVPFMLPIVSNPAGHSWC